MSSSLERCDLHALCEACRAIFGKAREVQEPNGVKVLSTLSLFGMYQLHDNIEHLEESIRKRCHFCTMASNVLFSPRRRNYVSEKDREWLPENMEKEKRDREARRAAMHGPVWILIRRNYYEEGEERIDITCGVRGETGLLDENFLRSFPERDGFGQRHEWRSLQFCTNQGMFGHDAVEESSSKMSMVHEAHSYMNTSSQAHMQLAQYWLDECLTKHPNCAKSGIDDLPSRLIYIHDVTSTHIRLHEPDKGSPRGLYKYCALSHCWGGAEDLLLLKKNNIADCFQAISINRLAKNFQDAIRITASLGIHYIWIDSLCIIQDDGDDWAKESAKMGSIYQNATCTIASSAAANSHQTCFVERNPLEKSPCRISGSSNNTLFITPTLVSGLSTVQASKLQSRAWVFQEAILSSRTIYFAKDGIYWSCKQGLASERDKDGWGNAKTGTPPKPIFGSALQTADWDVHTNFSLTLSLHTLLKFCASADWREPKALDTFDFWWHQVVGDYSKRELTKGEDKLAALSAVAQLIMRASGFTYSAGLWHESFAKDVLWEVGTPQAPAREAGYRAPSWSWAASDGHIRWESWSTQANSHQEILVELHSVTVSTHPQDKTKTGRVYDAKCKLRGKLKSTSELRWESKDADRFPDSQTRVRILKNDKIVGTLALDFAELPDIQSLFLIPVVCNTRKYEKKGSSKAIFGLAVKLCGERGCYERVGRFESNGPIPTGGHDDISATVLFNGCSEQDIELV